MSDSTPTSTPAPSGETPAAETHAAKTAAAPADPAEVPAEVAEAGSGEPANTAGSTQDPMGAAPPIDPAAPPVDPTGAAIPIDPAGAAIPIDPAGAAPPIDPAGAAPGATPAPPKKPSRFKRVGAALDRAGAWIARQFEGIPRRTIWLLFLTALGPPFALLVFDSILRREMFVNRAGPPVGGYIGGVFLSLSLWGFSLESARHPKRRIRYPAIALLAVTAFFGLGGQLLFRATSHEFYNRDAVLFAIQMWPIIFDYLMQDPLINLGILFGAAIVVSVYAIWRHRAHGPRQRLAAWGAGLALLACLLNAFIPWRAPASRHGLPPEVLFWHAAGGAGLYAVGIIDKPATLPPGKHQQLPPSKKPAAADAPDVVLIFGESVRRDEVCSIPSSDCKKSPGLDASAPNRIGFKHSFAVASCTEVSSAILWSGLHILTKSETMQTTPLVWDFAKARGYRTAYLTSQNLSFQDQGTFLRTSAIDRKVEARDRDPHSDVDIGSPDEGTANEVLQFLAEGGGPAFAVLHFSNTHLPYRQVEGHTPYQKVSDTPDGKKLANEAADQRHLKYLNSLYHQDQVIGDFVRELRKTERGKRTIVIYTADHGEAWGEHGSWTHTFDLFGEQINVPLWIDAPEGALRDDQRNELTRGAQSRPAYTADVTATVLDLLGALDEPNFKEQVSKLAGASLIRPRPTSRDIVLSNCPPFRGCFPESFGVVRWPLKYHYFGRDNDSSCANMLSDPAEKAQLHPDRCKDMRAIVEKHYGVRSQKSITKAAEKDKAKAAASGAPSAVPSAAPSATASEK